MADWKDNGQTDPSHRQKLAIALFEAFYQLAWKATYVQPPVEPSSEPGKQIESTLLQMAGSQEDFVLVGNAAASWLGLVNPESPGVLLSGVVKSVESEGAYFVTTLELTGKKRQELAVISRTNSTVGPRTYQVGSRVLLLGVIVRQPVQSISGYQGIEQLVVWSGPWVVITP